MSEVAQQRAAFAERLARQHLRFPGESIHFRNAAPSAGNGGRYALNLGELISPVLRVLIERGGAYSRDTA